MDRAHRIGQRRMVNVYRLITADSIEERIMNLQAFKTHLARTLVSQPANRSLAGMDTSHLLDNMSGAAADPLNTNWGGGEANVDVDIDQYAEESGAFLSRLSRKK